MRPGGIYTGGRPRNASGCRASDTDDYGHCSIAHSHQVTHVDSHTDTNRLP